MGKPDGLARLGSTLALVGLSITFGFSAAVHLLEGLVDRVPECVAGTLVGSVASLLVLPVGPLLVARASLREARLPGWARPPPLVATSLLVAVPVFVALVPEGRPEGQVAAILSAASGVAWAGYVLGMAAALDPDR